MTHEEFSRKGGKVTSQAKKDATRKNLEKAREAKAAKKNLVIIAASNTPQEKTNGFAHTYVDTLMK